MSRRRRSTGWLVLAGLVAGVIAAVFADVPGVDRVLDALGVDPPGSTSPAGPASTAGPYSVIRVVDGDTLHVDVDGVDTTVRLIGVDTPETVHPTEPVGCFGPEASNFTKAAVGQGPVWLEYDPSQGQTDKYGRALAYVWLDDGATLLQEQLIAGGFAREYTYDTEYARAGVLRAAQDQAKAAGAGLWSACAGED